jgi:uncharacterized protein
LTYVRVILLILITQTLISQTNDLDLLLKKEFVDSSYTGKPHVHYVFKDRNFFIKYNPVSLLFGGALYFYQAVISRQIMQGCAFDPSCSNFSRQCIRKFGVVKGVALSTDRLTRCTRLSAIDFHPVMFNPSGKVNDQPEFYSLKK